MAAPSADLWFFLRGQEQFQRNPDSYNGAVRENYTWSQDYTDLELKVPVPKHVVKGRQVTRGSCSCCARRFLGHRCWAVGWSVPSATNRHHPPAQPCQVGCETRPPGQPACAVWITPEPRFSNCNVLMSLRGFSPQKT